MMIKQLLISHFNGDKYCKASLYFKHLKFFCKNNFNRVQNRYNYYYQLEITISALFYGPEISGYLAINLEI